MHLGESVLGDKHIAPYLYGALRVDFTNVFCAAFSMKKFNDFIGEWQLANFSRRFAEAHIFENF